MVVTRNHTRRLIFLRDLLLHVVLAPSFSWLFESFDHATTRSRLASEKGCCRHSELPIQLCRAQTSDPLVSCLVYLLAFSIFSLWTRVWYETAKGLCFLFVFASFLDRKERETWHRRKSISQQYQHQISAHPASQRYNFFRLPSQVLLCTSLFAYRPLVGCLLFALRCVIADASKRFLCPCVMIVDQTASGPTKTTNRTTYSTISHRFIRDPANWTE